MIGTVCCLKKKDIHDGVFSGIADIVREIEESAGKHEAGSEKLKLDTLNLNRN